MDINIKVSQGDEAIVKSQKIRNEVFVCEQKIPIELDLDGADSEAFHALAYHDDKVIGVARLVIDKNGSATLARVAVTIDYRGNGIASQLIDALEAKGKEYGISKISIYPHEYLRIFYEKLGYEYEDLSEIVGDHQLLIMKKSLLSGD